MKTKLLDVNGQEKSTIELPKAFESKIREDLVSKAIESKKIKQPYSPSPVAGKQYSARGKIGHRRHVWKSQYGRGISRVPRKIMMKRGSQFNWEAAGVPNAKGGMRAHPPKIEAMLNFRKINKKEIKLAIESALSATANGKLISKRYSTLNSKKIEKVPFVVESNIIKLKTKELIESMKKILGNDLFLLVIKKKSIRKGKGKSRGRKYKSNAGLLIVVGSNEKLKTGAFEVVPANQLGVVDLAKGGLGRLTVYTEKAINEIGEKLK